MAHPPFLVDGVTDASGEGCYGALKGLDGGKRATLATRYGVVAKRMGRRAQRTKTWYREEGVDLDSDAHQALGKRAIRATLAAHPEMLEAFLATGPRPILHETGSPDPPGAEFPAAVFCRILTELREERAAKSA